MKRISNAMKKTIAFILRGKGKNIRNGWWVMIFLFLLAGFLFPLILLADSYDFELSVWLQTGIIALVTILCQTMRGKPLMEISGSINKVWWKELFIGLLLGAVLMLLPALILMVGGVVRWQLNYISAPVFLQGLILMMGVAMAEELLFRGFLFQRLVAAFGTWPAQLMTAAMFLLTHLDKEGMTGFTGAVAGVNIFIASILFGRAFLKSKNLAMPFSLHFMANVMQGPVLGFGVSGDQEQGLLKPLLSETSRWLSGGNFGLEASPVALILLIIITCSPYFRTITKQEGKV
ncbi:MAG: CPBP family intramembrane metalloprotease [Bacteroidetes bacterium]|nr:CPBP family intramembrane metalloprotease [Bacteroidota bacterium]